MDRFQSITKPVQTGFNALVRLYAFVFLLYPITYLPISITEQSYPAATSFTWIGMYATGIALYYIFIYEGEYGRFQQRALGLVIPEISVFGGALIFLAIAVYGVGLGALGLAAAYIQSVGPAAIPLGGIVFAVPIIDAFIARIFKISLFTLLFVGASYALDTATLLTDTDNSNAPSHSPEPIQLAEDIVQTAVGHQSSAFIESTSPDDQPANSD